MRKLGRILRRVLTAVSLMLFVAVLAAWVRGQFASDHISLSRLSLENGFWDRQDYGMEAGGGEMLVQRYWQSAPLHFSKTGAPWAGHWEWRTSSGESRRVAATHDRSYFMEEAAGIRKRWAWAGAYFSSVNGPYASDLVSGGTMGRTAVAFPCWMAAIVFGALPSWRCFVWWRGVRRRRLASRAGRCPVCGYDLRASPQRCPECGTAVGGKGE